MKKAVRLCFILLTGLVLITGCASSKKVTETTPIQDLKAPEWVMKGSGAFGGEKGKVFYGVASASRMQNLSLMRTAADNRARNEVAKVFQFYTASLMKDYAASTVAGDPNATSEEQHVEQAIKTVTSMTLSGVEVVDHWQNPATQELFALARLDLDSFKDNFDKMQTLDKKVKDYIRENADRMHEELEKEEAKRGPQQ
ncbi:MAG: LPP20 family lipoprotein [Nitrospirae bacterium]|nr:LPP20 family lipoprotein [Nitrospirota bacterium]